MNKKKLGVAVVSFAAVGMMSAAYAGLRTEMSVAVTPGAFLGTVTGTLGTARSSPGHVQQLGCTSWGDFAMCYGTNSAGVTGSCSTANQGHLNAIAQLNGDSTLIFGWDAADGSCVFVQVRNTSDARPK